MQNQNWGLSNAATESSELQVLDNLENEDRSIYDVIFLTSHWNLKPANNLNCPAECTEHSISGVEYCDYAYPHLIGDGNPLLVCALSEPFFTVLGF